MRNDFRNSATRIMYMVAINETTRMDMPPAEIASLLADGFELDIVIRAANDTPRPFVLSV